MNKIGLILTREYLSRIRKKSFILMSILGPFIFAAYILIPMYFATLEDKEEKTVVVIDDARIFTDYSSGQPAFVLPDSEYLKFKVIGHVAVETLKEGFEESGYYAVLYIPENILSSESALMYSNRQISMEVSNYIRSGINQEIEHLKLAANDINDIERILAEVDTNIRMRSIKWTRDGETRESMTGVVMGLGYGAGFLIFFFIFFFGSQVMRGVIEEKSSRIIEVMVSSVKPFQLMMGKILGVGLTGLTQFIIWVVLSTTLIAGLKAVFFPELNQTPTEQLVSSELFDPQAPSGNSVISDALSTEDMDMAQDIFASLKSIHLGVMVFSFLFFFIFGYLLYAALFAVVGSAVDQETDTQQLILPVILPLILSVYVMISAINNPDAALPFWFSIIPFTSPVLMMVRIPFGVPWWQVGLSAVLLVATFMGTTWVAARIYRTGILMYGKKANYRELWKWLRYRS
ncbi:MAG: ABC transporter permease [Bacteroidetes bacterium]|nr:MAG: ABC transporter permease [Bacteroidota bacterium]